MSLGLHERTWLNDEVINFYMEMIRERDNLISPKSIIHSSFFFTKIVDSDGNYNYTAVRRWAKQIIFSMQYLFSPINVNRSHWKLLNIFFIHKVIVIYDPLGCSESDVEEYGAPAFQVNIQTIFISIIIDTLMIAIVFM